MDSVIWLQKFRAQNASLLLKLDLKTSRKYTWSLRETTEKGDKLTDIIEHGIHRIKHSSDCVAVLCKELKEQANAGVFKMFVAVDCVNSFYRKPNIRLPDLSWGDVDNITIVRAFKKLLRNDWVCRAIFCLRYFSCTSTFLGISLWDDNFSIRLIILCSLGPFLFFSFSGLFCSEARDASLFC